MEIRSITLFCEPDLPQTVARSFFSHCREPFSYPVQTRRVAFSPFPGWWQKSDTGPALVQKWQAAGADYLSLGPVQLRHDPSWLEMLPALLGSDDALFASAEIAGRKGEIDIGRAHAVAAVIRTASTLQDSGFGNLYFTALANCPPGSPFFPVAYHGGGPPRFALAVEAADLAVTAIADAPSLPDAHTRLIAAVEEAAANLTAPAERLAEEQGIPFAGIDFSLAPFPEDEKSLAAAMEAVGIPWLGAAGSLFAAAFIADALDRAIFRRCGFSGLMLPVLEDSVLARRAAAGQVTISDLLAYAAVCGVGLDTVPLPGAVTIEALAAILLDVAALATRADKPLTARLMPLPGLEAGDPVAFSFPYFADSRVLPVAGTGTSRLLQQGAAVHLSSYHKRDDDGRP